MQQQVQVPASNIPCGACKSLRRKCIPGCEYAPYFPPENPQLFSNVNRVFGKNNLGKLLNKLEESQRKEAVKSLGYQAEARLRDPVHGCVGLISMLQQELSQIKAEMAMAKKELSRYVSPQIMNYLVAHPGAMIVPLHQVGVAFGGNSSNAAAFGLPGNFPPPNDMAQVVMVEHGQGQVVVQDQFLEERRAAEQQQQLQAMRWNYEQQQKQQQQQQGMMVRYNSGFEAAGGRVAVSGSGGGGSRVHGGEIPPPSLAQVDDAACSYQMQQQPKK